MPAKCRVTLTIEEVGVTRTALEFYATALRERKVTGGAVRSQSVPAYAAMSDALDTVDAVREHLRAARERATGTGRPKR